MKHYHIYAFSQDGCAPCDKFKEYLETLTEAERAEVDVVPLKAPNGSRTALAEELQVELSPTLVVVDETQQCSIDPELEDEFCDLVEVPVETVVGAKAIIKQLNGILDAYTYAHVE